MRKFLFAFLAAGLFLPTISAQARLPDNWKTSFKPGEGWQLGCPFGEVPEDGSYCRTMAVYYFQIKGDEVAPDDVIFSMTHDQRRGWVAISPWEGKCVGGTIKVDGDVTIQLGKGHTGCEPMGGKPFMQQEYGPKEGRVSLFAGGKEMELNLVLESGEKISQKMPLAGFKEKYDALLEAMLNTGRGGGRGGR